MYPRGVFGSNATAKLLVALVCAGTLALAGCGSGSGSGSTATTVGEGPASLNPTLSRRDTIEKEQQAQAEQEQLAREKGLTSGEGEET